MKRRFNASAKKATITIPKESETMRTKIKATSSGKLHLSNFEDSAICVKNNKTMKFVETLSNEIALKADKGAFCKRCFGDEDPHKVIKEMVKIATSEKVPAKKLTTVDATESMQKKLAEKAQNEAFNLDIKYIYEILERLRERKDGEFNTKYMKRKARFRWECMQVVIEMLETGNKKVLERLIME